MDALNQVLHNRGINQDDRFDIILKIMDGKTHDYKEVEDILNSFDYSNQDLIQELFMKMGSKYTKKNLDQFYTPLTISNFISKWMDPEKTVIDPAGGTGDLLVFHKGHKTIWDIDEKVVKLCKLNYGLRKDNNILIDCKDSLKGWESFVETWDYVVMNPPFGTNTVVRDENILKNFTMGHNKKKQEIGVMFIELGLKLLKENGTMFVIVPTGYLNNKQHKELRDMLLQNKIVASISLPENTFKRSGTGVDTCLLIFQKTVCINYDIKMAKLKNIGYELSKKNTPILYKRDRKTGNNILDESGNKIINNDFNHFEEFVEKVNITKISNTILGVERYMKEYVEYSSKGTPIKSFCKIIKNGTKIDKEGLYKYIDISKVNTPFYTWSELYGWELPSRARYLVKKNDILVSRLKGKISYCMILQDQENLIVTNGFVVIRPNTIGDMYTIFSNIMKKEFQVQHNTLTTGSIMATISDEDFSNIKIYEGDSGIESLVKAIEKFQNLSLC